MVGRTLRVVVAGGYGRTGTLVVWQLAAAGHQVTGLVRRERQLPRIAARGAQGVLVDLTEVTPADFAPVLRGADALVITTGSSYGNTAQEAVAIDRDAPITCIDAAVSAAVPHVVLISAHRTDEDFGDAQTLTVVRAKRTADAHLRSQRSLRWTILRPDALSGRGADRPREGRRPCTSRGPASRRSRRRRGRGPHCERQQRAVRAHGWPHSHPRGRPALDPGVSRTARQDRVTGAAGGAPCRPAGTPRPSTRRPSGGDA